jgi:hypothetical protein
MRRTSTRRRPPSDSRMLAPYFVWRFCWGGGGRVGCALQAPVFFLLTHNQLVCVHRQGDNDRRAHLELVEHDGQPVAHAALDLGRDVDVAAVHANVQRRGLAAAVHAGRRQADCWCWYCCCGCRAPGACRCQLRMRRQLLGRLGGEVCVVRVQRARKTARRARARAIQVARPLRAKPRQYIHRSTCTQHIQYQLSSSHSPSSSPRPLSPPHHFFPRPAICPPTAESMSMYMW